LSKVAWKDEKFVGIYKRLLGMKNLGVIYKGLVEDGKRNWIFAKGAWGMKFFMDFARGLVRMEILWAYFEM